MKLTTHIRPVSRLRTSGAFNLHAFTACTRTSLQISYFRIRSNLSHINSEIRTSVTFATKKQRISIRFLQGCLWSMPTPRFSCLSRMVRPHQTACTAMNSVKQRFPNTVPRNPFLLQTFLIHIHMKNDFFYTFGAK